MLYVYRLVLNVKINCIFEKIMYNIYYLNVFNIYNIILNNI